MRTDFISFMSASHQRVFLFSLSKSKASLMVFRTWIPNLWVVFWYYLLAAAMIHCHFCSTSLVHQAKAGSSWMPRAVAYSATSMGYDSFISLNFSQDMDLSFYWTQSIHPLVVRFMCFLPRNMKYISSF